MPGAGSKLTRGLCFTHNNWAEGDIDRIIEAWKEKAKYIVIGKEVGQEGTPHLQGYIQFKTAIRVKRASQVLKEALAKGCYTEASKGSPDQNRTYCTKGDDYVEWGTIPVQGKRQDLEAAYEDARSDIPMIDVADMHRSAFIRYHKGIKAVRELHNEAEAEAWRTIRVVVHSGPTGCGKTKAAMEWLDGDDKAPYKIQGRYLKWWDRYEGHKKIVIDEYNNNVAIDEMLALLDGYKLRLPVKGGFTYARWSEVHITTNLKWEQWHEQAKEEHKAALKRRITEWRDYWEETPWTKAKSAMEIPKKDYYMECFSDETGKAL